jgi:NAD(P)-dependent dehydrogenase (short-subunit alcohol dehydrogenase family)
VRSGKLAVTESCAARAEERDLREKHCFGNANVGIRGGFTEAIAPELVPFGVKVCAVEPGGMRTNWGKRANRSFYPTMRPL